MLSLPIKKSYPNSKLARPTRAPLQPTTMMYSAVKLRCRNIKLEAYTRRENKKIFNLPDIRGEIPSDTEVLVKPMFEAKMNILKEDVDEIWFERVHRLPTRCNQTNPNKPKI